MTTDYYESEIARLEALRAELPAGAVLFVGKNGAPLDSRRLAQARPTITARPR